MTKLDLSKVKKGQEVTMLAFTGMNLGHFPVVAADKTTITVMAKKGERKFRRKDGKQIVDEGKERFANSITQEIIPFESPLLKAQKVRAEKAAAKAAAKKAKKAPKKAPEPVVYEKDDFDDEFEDDEEWEDDEYWEDDEE